MTNGDGYKAQSVTYGLGVSLEDGPNLGYMMDGAICNEQKLWRAVIARAVLDAMSETKGKSIHAKQANLIKMQARAWLIKSKDFHTVCQLAGLDNSVTVKTKILKYIVDPTKNDRSHFHPSVHPKDKGERKNDPMEAFI